MLDLMIMMFSYLGVISICVGMSVIADQAPATIQHQPRPVAASRDKSWGRQDRDNSGRDENGEKDDRGTENFGRNVKFSTNVKRFSDGRIGDRLGRLHGRWVSAAIELSASKSFLTLKGSSSSVIRDSKKEKKDWCHSSSRGQFNNPQIPMRCNFCRSFFYLHYTNQYWVVL